MTWRRPGLCAGAGWRVVYDPDVIVDHYPAQRHDDARDARSTEAVLAEEHNEVYALMRHASWWQGLILLHLPRPGG